MGTWKHWKDSEFKRTEEGGGLGTALCTNTHPRFSVPGLSCLTQTHQWGAGGMNIPPPSVSSRNSFAGIHKGRNTLVISFRRLKTHWKQLLIVASPLENIPVTALQGGRKGLKDLWNVGGFGASSGKCWVSHCFIFLVIRLQILGAGQGEAFLVKKT